MNEVENPTQALLRLESKRSGLRAELNSVCDEIVEKELEIKRVAANAPYTDRVESGTIFKYCGAYYRIDKKEGSGWLGDGTLVRVHVPDLTPTQDPEND